MKRNNCTECKGTGLVVSRAGNRWCDCPLGREYVTEINSARKHVGKAPMVEAAKPSGPTLH